MQSEGERTDGFLSPQDFLRLREILVPTDEGVGVIFHVTPREREILNALVKYDGVKQVASFLGIPLRTVWSHISKLKKKFNVDSLHRLMACWLLANMWFRWDFAEGRPRD